jgi:murein DD-endopeptidase MepM/ murein hydrolase activator NlpD
MKKVLLLVLINTIFILVTIVPLYNTYVVGLQKELSIKEQTISSLEKSNDDMEKQYIEDLQYIVNSIYENKEYMNYRIGGGTDIAERYSVDIYREIVLNELESTKIISYNSKLFIRNISSMSEEIPDTLPLYNQPILQITSPYGWRRNPFTGEPHFHEGIDLAGKKNSEVISTAKGRVIEVLYDHYDFGKTIVIQHPNGIKTKYAHLSEIKVRTGDKVEKGQIIGKTGSSGKSTGDHLHYVIINQGKTIDPLIFIDNYTMKEN